MRGITLIDFPRKDPGYNREYSKLRRTVNYQQQKEYRKLHQIEIREWNKQWARRKNSFLKGVILIALGGICVCCGEFKIEFLSIDHIKGGGSQEKKKYRGLSTYYQYIIDQGIPKDKYQILCHNCNQSKGTQPNCAHYKFNIFDKTTYC